MSLHSGDEGGLRLERVLSDETCGAQHPQRIVGEADLWSERRAQHAGREVVGTAERIDELGRLAAPVSSSAIALTVKSRRPRSDSMASANTTCGLRESSVYDSARNVVISKVWRRSPVSRWAPIVPNFSPWVQIDVGPPVEAALDVGRAGVGGQVDVGVGRCGADEQVADGAADQVQVVSRRREPLGQRRQLGEQGREAVGGHDSPGYGGRSAAGPSSGAGTVAELGGRISRLRSTSVSSARPVAALGRLRGGRSGRADVTLRRGRATRPSAT